MHGLFPIAAFLVIRVIFIGLNAGAMSSCVNIGKLWLKGLSWPAVTEDPIKLIIIFILSSSLDSACCKSFCWYLSFRTSHEVCVIAALWRKLGNFEICHFSYIFFKRSVVIVVALVKAVMKSCFEEKFGCFDHDIFRKYDSRRQYRSNWQPNPIFMTHCVSVPLLSLQEWREDSDRYTGIEIGEEWYGTIIITQLSLSCIALYDVNHQSSAALALPCDVIWHDFVVISIAYFFWLFCYVFHSRRKQKMQQ